MKFYATQYNRPAYAGEVNDEPSMTVPDQTMSMRTILERHSRGLPVMGNPNQPYFQGEDGNDVHIERLDLAEREDLLNTRKAEYNALMERFKLRTMKQKEKVEEKPQKQVEPPKSKKNERGGEDEH